MRSTFPTASFRAARLLLLCAAASAALYSASCSSGGGTTGAGGAGGDMEDPALADVIYEGATTDEAVGQLLAAKPVTASPKAPVVDVPTEGAALPASPIPAFTWHNGATGMLPAAPSIRFAARPGLTPPSALAALFGPERAARAHGAPFNGTGYLLVFSTDADPKLVRVFTDKTTFTPDAATWGKLTKAGVTITLTITSGIFDNNDLAADGGPYQGTAVKFTVKP